MNIEEKIFKKCRVDYKKLITYGFKKDKDYKYETNILNNSFRLEIVINKKVNIKVIDLSSNEEYVNYRIKTINGEFVSRVREEIEKVLKDIKDKCFIELYFSLDQANRITNYIIDKYNNKPEFLWEDNTSGVFRCDKNKKWYGIIMNIPRNKISNGNDLIDVINVKLDPDKIKELLIHKGYYEAYHMNKKYWITLPLDDSLSDEDIIKCIDMSYNLIKEK